MTIYSYVVEHDYGLAPNPFGAYCTLAVCKPKIRKSKQLKINDWIIGTGSKALEKIAKRDYRNHLIYAMKVEEIITLQQYWDDSRFQYKKPVLNGPLTVMYGDNFYHKNEKGDWIQEDSAHSDKEGKTNLDHLEGDTNGENALISSTYYYFGNEAPLIPNDLHSVCHSGIGEKKITHAAAEKFINWLQQNFTKGIHGDPINWIEHIK
jgi:hypothetical protein